MFCRSAMGQEGPAIKIEQSLDHDLFTNDYLSCVNNVLSHQNFLVPLVSEETTPDIEIFSILDRPDFQRSLQHLGIQTADTRGVAIYPNRGDLLTWSEFDIHRRALWDLSYLISRRITESAGDDDLGTNKLILQMSSSLILSKAYSLEYEEKAANQMLKEMLNLSLCAFAQSRGMGATKSSHIFFLRYPQIEPMIETALDMAAGLRMKTAPHCDWFVKKAKEMRNACYSFSVQRISSQELAI